MSGAIPHIWWVTGRRKALARGLAVELANAHNRKGSWAPGWLDLPREEQTRWLSEAEAILDSWVASELLIKFPAEFREPTRATTPVDPTEKTRK